MVSKDPSNELDPTLSVHNLDVMIGKTRILSQISFSAHRGEILGIVGPNGAGKSTLLHALTAATRYTGKVEILGEELANLSPQLRAQYLAFVAQDTSTELSLTVEEVILLGASIHTSSRKEATLRCESALKQTGLTELRYRRINQLSGGQKQLVHITRALAQNTPIILLDEPLSALDMNYQTHILNLLTEARGEGKTIVLTVHDLATAAQVCDRLALIASGTLKNIGAPDQVLTSDSVTDHYGLPVTVFRDPLSGRLRLISQTSTHKATTIGLEFAQW